MKILKILFLSAFPMLFGGLIYLSFRDTSLLMFRWVEIVGLTESVITIRTTLQETFPRVPEWIRYSLPDGIWIFSLSILLGEIWIESSFHRLVAWLLVAPVLGIGGEMGQAIGVVPGSFCLVDVAVSLILSIAAMGVMFIARKAHEK